MSEVRLGNKDVAAIDRLLDRLADPDPVIQGEANHTLASMPLNEIMAVLKRSYHYVPRSRRQAGLLVGLGTGVLIFAACFWSMHMLLVLFFAILGSIAAFAFTAAAVSTTLQNRIFSIISDRMLRVTEIKDLNAVLDFISGSYYTAGSTDLKGYYQYSTILKNRIRETVGRILPSIDRQTYQSLSMLQRQGLYLLLREPYVDIYLTKLLIQAIGEYDDLKHLLLRAKLEEFAHQGTPTANMKAVKEAARRALARIKERQEQEAEAHSLLRGSSLPADNQADVLLRPAGSSSQTPSEELVRAAMQKTESEDVA